MFRVFATLGVSHRLVKPRGSEYVRGMQAGSRTAPILVEWLFRSRAALLLLTAGYTLLGWYFVATDYALNNEGLLTYHWADWARHEFAATFFYQKVKPVLAAIYAPVSLAGPRATLAVHTAVAAAALPLLALTARSIGYRWPNAPAWIFALSPVYLLGGASGVSNVDGAVGVAAVLYLLTDRTNPFAAGLLAGALPWVRFELALFAASLAVLASFDRQYRRALWGLTLFPGIYVLAGAVYHQDLLWLAAYPPSAPFDPTNPIYASQRIGLGYFLEPALSLTPLAAAIVLLRARALQPIERFALGYLLLAAFAINVLPIFKIGNFGTAPRYSLLMLPALALLLGRAAEDASGTETPMWKVVALAALAAWLTSRQEYRETITAMTIAYVAIVALLFRARRAWLPVAMMLTLAAGPWLPLRVELARSQTAAYADPVMGWFAKNPIHPSAIFTNAQLLALLLESSNVASEGKVTFLAGEDIRREIYMANAANGQRAALERMVRERMYGETLLEPLRPENVVEGAIFALRVESRLDLLLPPELWSNHLDILDESPVHRIARFRPRP